MLSKIVPTTNNKPTYNFIIAFLKRQTTKKNFKKTFRCNTDWIYFIVISHEYAFRLY